MSAEAKRVLQRARELVAAGWTQGCCARDVTGRPVGSHRREIARKLFPNAVCYCAHGALAEADHEINPLSDEIPSEDNAYGILHGAVVAAGGLSVPSFNDSPGRTQAEVLAVSDAAVEWAST
jgi:hypothetical protein